ncbi:MAG: amidohydrolase family protein, partial [Microbacterium sp.]
LELLASLGATPAEVLEMATSGNARILGIEADAGAIASGMAADMVLLDEDPLTDIGNCRSIRWVMKDGVVHHA